LHYFECDLVGEPQIQENGKHTAMKRIEKIPFENTLGFAIKIDDTIISDEEEIRRNFVDFCIWNS